MKQVSLSGSPRAGVGKKDAATIRKKGLVPCVLYGGSEQLHFSVKYIDIHKIVHSPDVYNVALEVEGKKQEAIIQELQFHPVTDKILHVDFLALHNDKPAKIELPVRVSGASPGVLMGGKLAKNFQKIKVEALPADLPEAINIDITPLNIGDNIRVRDLAAANTKLSFHAPAASVVVGVKMARGAKKADDEPAKK